MWKHKLGMLAESLLLTGALGQLHHFLFASLPSGGAHPRLLALNNSLPQAIS